MKAAWSVVVALTVGLVVGCGAGAIEEDPGVEEALATSESELAVCGDGVCEPIERLRCPADCPPGGYCGNRACCPGETTENCPEDCTQGNPGNSCYRTF